jgi:ankyrin repeat protein
MTYLIHRALSHFWRKGKSTPTQRKKALVLPYLGKTLLMYSCEKGDPSITNTLINSKADPNEQDNNGRTALFYAMSNANDNRDAILMLLQSSKYIIRH